MRKEASLVLTGLIAFDLGTVVVPAHAADTIYMKIDNLSADSDYLKLNGLKATDACVAGKGTLVEFKGDKYCRTAKARAPGTATPANAAPAKTGPATALPSNQGAIPSTQSR